MRTPHEVLGVAPGATPDAIKQAWRRQSMREHPDRNPGDPGAADRFREIQSAYAALSGGPTVGSSGVSPRGAGFHAHGMDVDVEALFEHLFARAPRPRVHLVEVPIPWAVALAGGDYSVDFDGQSWTVALPAGLADGDRLRVAPPPGHPGDWAWVVRVRPPPGFRREGNDIHGTLCVPAFRAAIGGTCRWELWDGLVEVHIPPGTQPGAVFRLAGRGAAHPRHPARGDLYCHVAVSVPESLTSTQRATLAAWLGDPLPPGRPRRKK